MERAESKYDIRSSKLSVEKTGINKACLRKSDLVTCIFKLFNQFEGYIVELIFYSITDGQILLIIDKSNGTQLLRNVFRISHLKLVDILYVINSNR